MKFIKIIKNGVKNLKFSKKDTILTIISIVWGKLSDRLFKEYLIFRIVARILAIFRKWFVHMSLFSLIYSAIAAIFSFQYDYRFIVSFSYGLILLLGEFLCDFTDNIFDYWCRLLNKISNKVVDHSTEDNKVINTKSADQIKHLADDQSRSFRGEPHSDKIKITHINTNQDEYNALKDWRVWLAAGVITVAALTAIHFYGPEYSTVKESAKSLYDKMKSYFSGKPDDDSGSSSADSIYTTTRKQQLEEAKAVLDKKFNQDVSSSNASTPTPSSPLVNKGKLVEVVPEPALETEIWRGPGTIEERNRLFPLAEDVNKTSSSNGSPSSSDSGSSSGTVTPKAATTSNISSTDEPSNSPNIHVWNFDSFNDFEQREFYDEFTNTLGQLVHFNNQIQRMLASNVNFEILAKTDRKHYRFEEIRIKSICIDFYTKWNSKCDLSGSNEIMDFLYKIAVLENIEEIPEPKFDRAVDKIINRANKSH